MAENANKNMRLPENVAERWFRPNKMVAKTRPDVHKVEVGIVPGDPKHLVVRVWYDYQRQLHQVSGLVPVGAPWEATLAEALEFDFTERLGVNVP